MDTPSKYSHIEGWGVDLDRANRPAYPMERMPPRLDNPPSGPPEQQVQHVEILQSNERPRMTRVFGTTLPPRGLSGRLRRLAFRFSENDLRHWLVLLFADRVDVGEGLVDDLSRGHVPNIYAEMGGNAELRHNPMGAVRKVLGLAAVLGLVYVAARPRRGRRR